MFFQKKNKKKADALRKKVFELNKEREKFNKRCSGKKEKKLVMKC